MWSARRQNFCTSYSFSPSRCFCVFLCVQLLFGPRCLTWILASLAPIPRCSLATVFDDPQLSPLRGPTLTSIARSTRHVFHRIPREIKGNGSALLCTVEANQAKHSARARCPRTNGCTQRFELLVHEAPPRTLIHLEIHQYMNTSH